MIPEVNLWPLHACTWMTYSHRCIPFPRKSRNSLYKKEIKKQSKNSKHSISKFRPWNRLPSFIACSPAKSKLKTKVRSCSYMFLLSEVLTDTGKF